MKYEFSRKEIRELDRDFNPKKIRVDIKSFIKKWNRQYPWDSWWRKKFSIPFGSEQHRKTSFIDMLIQYEEALYLKKIEEASSEEEEAIDEIIGLSDKKESIKMSKKDLDTTYDELDLDEFN